MPQTESAFRPTQKRRISPLTLRILAINILALAVLLGGLLYLDLYREGLVEAKTDALTTNGSIIAGALGEQAGTSLTGLPVLQPRAARTMVRRLAALTGTRARLFGERGDLLADSRVLVSAGRAVRSTPLDLEPSADNGALDLVFDWFSQLLRGQPNLPLYRQGSTQHARNFEEAVAAYDGNVTNQLRMAANGEVLISVAFPVQRFKKVLGVLVLSVGTADVEVAVARARLAILGVAAVALAVTVMLSLYLAGSIVRPIHRLAEAAESVRRRPSHRGDLPDLSERGDEIGDLSQILRSMTDTLYDRLDAIEGFAADVAHEIRNPLTSIRSAVEVLARGGEAEAQQRLIAIIEDDVRRLDRLIGDISDASRLDAELARVDPKPLDLVALTETVIDITRSSAAAEGLAFNFDIEREIVVNPDNAPDERMVVSGMESGIGQVLRNLLENAASFSPPGGEIQVRLMRRGGYARLLVDDAGPGLPEEKLDAVFDRFYSERLDNEAFGEHSGLGLSISRQIIAAHEGQIRAENRRDEGGNIVGARFVVELPISGSSASN